MVNFNEITDQAILTASASGVPRFTVSRADITVNGQKDIVTSGMSNVNDVFVYDTTKDMDGGRWRMDDRAKASSWYNEALDDGASDPCVNDTDDRCGRRISRKSDHRGHQHRSVYFDAKDNSQWMNFDVGNLIRGNTTHYPKSVFALNGKIYIAIFAPSDGNGTAQVVDFIKDRGEYWLSDGYYIYQDTISARNTVATYTNVNASWKIVNNGVYDVSANVICSSNINV